MRRTIALLALPLAGLLAAEPEQVPVAVGKGSFASGPSLTNGKFAEKYRKIPFIHPSQAGKPVPTNDWWTDLVMGGPGGDLWAYPTIVKCETTGIQVGYSTGWSDKRGGKGSPVERSVPLEIRPVGTALGKTSAPADALTTNVLSWGDWTVVARQEIAARQEKGPAQWDVTFGHGLPYVWIESRGLVPSLRSQKPMTLLDVDGKPWAGGKADAFIVQIEGATYGVYGPPGMTVTAQDSAWNLGFTTGTTGWIAVATLPTVGDAPGFRAAAGAVPRDSRYAWSYDRGKGAVTTTFDLTTEALRPDASKPLQGFLPHHLKAEHAFTPTGPTFTTPRGPLVLVAGNHFELTYPFAGILPWFPAPAAGTTGEHPYQPERMAGFLKGLDDLRTAKKPAGDTYWGGKDLQKVAQYAAIATQIGDPTAAPLTDKLRGYLGDWFTFSGAADKQYFARYPTWKGLVGFPSSFGSEFFTDNHFHYGYFTMSAGILGSLDPKFLAEYGGMARLVAKQYANWDRQDPDFPFLRTFDPWAGHSYAGGSSSRGGNNQESTSEAMNAWAGLVQLGNALGDQDMVACGAMGWAVEGEAIAHYWYDYYTWKGEKNVATRSPSYDRAVISILGDSGGAYATFFSGAPQHVFGIQWLPLSPALTFLGRDPAYVRHLYDAVLADMAADKKPTTLSSIGDSWGNVLLGLLQLGDPAAAVAEMDRLFAAGDKVGTSAEAAGIPYFMAHAGLRYGTIAWGWSAGCPTSAVFRKGDQLTAAVWNPGDQPLTVDLRGPGSRVTPAPVVKQITAPPHRLTLTTLTAP